MNAREWTQLILLLLALLATAAPLGSYLDRVFSGDQTLLSPALGRFECGIYSLLRLRPEEEQTWPHYTLNLLLFGLISCVVTYAALRLQTHLPFNPEHLPSPSPDLALSATVGFHTNSSWQSYSGEQALSYFSQTGPLLLQFFLSPAIGLCASTALIRGFARRESRTIGNFWADLVRGLLYVLLPLGLLFSFALLSEGAAQTFAGYVNATTLEGLSQRIALGPTASFTALKILGTNGGGFFNANGAHPFDNPTPLVNFLQIFLMLLLPSAILCQFGRATRHSRHAWTVWLTLATLLAAGALACCRLESNGNPLLTKLGAASAGNWEGKEARFGLFGSALYAAATTATSCGSVNAALDSFTPLGGLVPLFNMHLSEVIFGGVGSGLCGILMFTLTTVFIAGLMIGRTPEYLGKRIEAIEMKFVTLAVVATAFLTLLFSAWGALDARALAGLGNGGAHGFTEILYDYTSATMNNGSALSGLNTNSPFWNLTLSFVLFYGRYFTLIPMLAIAGSMARKRPHPIGPGTFRTEGPLFAALFVAVIVLLGALSFFPALALGPVAEHFRMLGAGVP